MILIVDDSPINIEVLINSINGCDDIAVALNAKEALEILQDEIPDIILLDIYMPEINGFELCIKLKQEPALKNIPVIFMSGNDSEEEKNKAFSAGAAAYLTKPVNEKKLFSLLKEYIAND